MAGGIVKYLKENVVFGLKVRISCLQLIERKHDIG